MTGDEPLVTVHGILHAMFNRISEVRALAVQPHNGITTEALFAIGEAFGVLSKAKALVGQCIDYPEHLDWPPPRLIDDNTPKDRRILVYAPPRDGLPGFKITCVWHPDGGFCVDELREATHWWELPPDPAETATKGNENAV